MKSLFCWLWFLPLNSLLGKLRSTYNTQVHHEPIMQQLRDFTVLLHFLHPDFVCWAGVKSLLLAVTELSPKALQEQQKERRRREMAGGGQFQWETDEMSYFYIVCSPKVQRFNRCSRSSGVLKEGRRTGKIWVSCQNDNCSLLHLHLRLAFSQR